MAGIICKIAFQTAFRNGATALIILTLGLSYMLNAISGYIQLYSERSAPLEVSGVTSGASLEDCQNLDCVRAITPVLTFETTLTYENDTLTGTVQAVTANYPQLSFVQGGIYPERSNMPFLVMNEYVAEHLSQEKTLGINSQLTMTINGVQRKAIVCGVFRDGLEKPVIYMSYSLVAKELPKEESTSLLVLLEEGSMAEQAQKELQRLNVRIAYDENLLLRWSLQSQQTARSVVAALALILCVSVLIRKQNREDREDANRERQMLLLAGLTERHIRQILRLRILLFSSGCFLLALAVAAAM